MNTGEPSRTQQQEVKLDFVSIGTLSGGSSICLPLEVYSLGLQLLPVSATFSCLFLQNTLLCLFVSIHVTDSTHRPGLRGCIAPSDYIAPEVVTDSQWRMCASCPFLVQLAMARRRGGSLDNIFNHYFSMRVKDMLSQINVFPTIHKNKVESLPSERTQFQ